MLIQVLRPREVLLRQGVGVLWPSNKFGPQLRIIGTVYVQHRLALVYLLAGHNHNATHGTAHLSDHRRSVKTVVGYCASQT